MKKNNALAPKTSPRPMKRPAEFDAPRPKKRPADLGAAPKTAPRPQPRPEKNPMTGDFESTKETQTRLDSYSDYYSKGGTVKMKMKMKEGSAKDMREDKAMAKKSGMTMKKWEKSAADKKHDAPKKMAGGGIVRGAGAAIRGKRYMGEC